MTTDDDAAEEDDENKTTENLVGLSLDCNVPSTAYTARSLQNESHFQNKTTEDTGH